MRTAAYSPRSAAYEVVSAQLLPIALIILQRNPFGNVSVSLFLVSVVMMKFCPKSRASIVALAWCKKSPCLTVPLIGVYMWLKANLNNGIKFRGKRFHSTFGQTAACDKALRRCDIPWLIRANRICWRFLASKIISTIWTLPMYRWGYRLFVWGKIFPRRS